MVCPRCDTALKEENRYLYCCWLCDADICPACWDEKGHCGHPEADAANMAARAGLTREMPIPSASDYSELAPLEKIARSCPP